MVYASSIYSAGGISYDIVAVDRTKEAIDSATQGIDTVSVKFSDTLTNIAFNFNMVMMAAQTAFSAIQSGYDQTIGAAIAYQDQIEYMHNTLGMTTDDAQKWKDAAVATDTDITAVATSMRYLEQRISDTGTSGENLRATLKGIGVDVKDSNGNYKDASTLLQEILAALNQIPAGAERARVASEIFGNRNWANMAEMIENADTALKKFHDSQPVIDEEEIERIDRAKLKIAAFSKELEDAKVKAGVAVIDIGESTINGMKIWDAALRLDLQGIKDAVKEMNDAELEINAATRKAFEESLPVSGKGMGAFVPTGTGPFGTTIGLFKQGSDELAVSQKNLYLNLSDTEREIMYQSEVVIPKYTQALADAEVKGKGVAEAQYNLANAIDHLADLKSQDTEKTKAQVDAYKEYQSAIEKANDAKKKLYDLDQSFAMDMQNAGMDVAAGRRAYQSYQKSRIGALETFGEAQMGVQESATEFNAVQSGTPLEQVKGTEQYEKAQATTIGQITIENINLSQDYTANDFMNDLTAGRIAKGVPLAK